MEYRLAGITLRAVSHDDLDEVARMWDYGKGEISLAEAERAIEWMQMNHAQNRPGRLVHACFGVFDNSTGRIIGWCGLDGRSGVTLEIFYLIDADHRRRGYATECAWRMLEFGFTQMAVGRIDGGCAVDNLASQKILEKIGMTPMAGEPGTLRYFLTRDAYASAGPGLA